MDKKQKARKHLLRRLITNAALAGTAFSTFGGALASTMEVKADEMKNDSVYKFIVEKIAERGGSADRSDRNHWNEKLRTRSDKEILFDIREFLKSLSVDELQDLVLDFDNFRLKYPFSNLNMYNNKLGSFHNDSRDVYQTGLSFTSLLVQEINARKKSNEEKRIKLQEKDVELAVIKDRERELSKEKLSLDEKLEAKGYEAESKGQKLKETEAKLVEETRRANLNGLAKIELEKQRDVAKDKVAELSAQLEKVNKEHDEFAKLAAAAQADYEKELLMMIKKSMNCLITLRLLRNSTMRLKLS